MKELKTFLLLFSLLLFMSFTFLLPNRNGETWSLVNFQQEADTSRWIAPESANELVNPIEVDEESMEEGEALYRKHCRSCHGRLGDGKGTGAADLETVPTDFTNPDFLNQSDGSMFWKIKVGRDEMESYEKKVDEEETWMIVVYIKSFGN